MNNLKNDKIIAIKNNKNDFSKLPTHDIEAVVLLSGLMPAKMKGYNPQKYIDVNITGKDRVGGFVGYRPGGIFESYVVGNISGGNRVAGLVGNGNNDGSSAFVLFNFFLE